MVIVTLSLTSSSITVVRRWWSREVNPLTGRTVLYAIANGPLTAGRYRAECLKSDCQMFEPLHGPCFFKNSFYEGTSKITKVMTPVAGSRIRPTSMQLSTYVKFDIWQTDITYSVCPGFTSLGVWSNPHKGFAFYSFFWKYNFQVFPSYFSSKWDISVNMKISAQSCHDCIVTETFVGSAASDKLQYKMLINTGRLQNQRKNDKCKCMQ